MNELMTPCAVARLIGKSEQTVTNYGDANKIPCIRTSTGRRLFRREDVEAFLKNRVAKRDGEPPEAA